MKTAIYLAAAAAVAEAAISPAKMNMLSRNGIDLDMMLRKTEIMMSKSARSLHKAQIKSNHLQATYNKRKLGQVEGDTFDEKAENEEERLLEYVCEDGEEDCDQETIDYVEFAFNTAKGLVVGVSAVYSEECRSGLVGVVDSALNLYDHIEIYLPQNFNKFGIAFNDLTQAGNIVFAHCDLTHFYNELTKLGDW